MDKCVFDFETLGAMCKDLSQQKRGIFDQPPLLHLAIAVVLLIAGTVLSLLD